MERMAPAGWTLTLECKTCHQIWTRNTRTYPDDGADYYRTGPCGHDVSKILNIVDLDE